MHVRTEDKKEWYDKAAWREMCELQAARREAQRLPPLRTLAARKIITEFPGSGPHALAMYSPPCVGQEFDVATRVFELPHMRYVPSDLLSLPERMELAPESFSESVL